MSDFQVVQGVAKAASKFWKLAILRGVVAAVAGVLLLVDPARTLEWLVWIVGAFLVVDGVLLLFGSLTAKDEGGAPAEKSGWRIGLAVVTVVGGAALMLWPQTISSLAVDVVVWIIVVWALVFGLLASVRSLRARAAGVLGWEWGLAIGVLSVVLGLVLLFRSEAVEQAVAVVVGLYLITVGVLQLVSAYSVKTLAAAAAKAGDPPAAAT